MFEITKLYQDCCSPRALTGSQTGFLRDPGNCLGEGVGEQLHQDSFWGPLISANAAPDFSISILFGVLWKTVFIKIKTENMLLKVVSKTIALIQELVSVEMSFYRPPALGLLDRGL